jgi:5-methylcytosine-specific restriction protein B
MEKIEISFRIPGGGEVVFTADPIEEKGAWVGLWDLRGKFKDEHGEHDLKPDWPIGIYKKRGQTYYVYWAKNRENPRKEDRPFWSISGGRMVPPKKKKQNKQYEQFKKFVMEVLKSLKINGKKPNNLNLSPEKDAKDEFGHIGFGESRFNPEDPDSLSLALAVAIACGLVVTKFVNGFSGEIRNKLTDKVKEALKKLNNTGESGSPSEPVSSSNDAELSKLSDYLASSGLLFPDYLSPAFWNALRTKGFVFLAGLTGTGKTKLAVKIAEALSAKIDWENAVALSLKGARDKLRGKRYIRWKGSGVRKEAKERLRNASSVNLIPALLYKSAGEKQCDDFILVDCYNEKGNFDDKEKLTPDNTYNYEYEGEANAAFSFYGPFKLAKPHKPDEPMEHIWPLEKEEIERLSSENENLALKNENLALKTFLFISVRPDWTDKTELLGWVNPLAKEGEPRYRKGLVLDFILRAVEDYGNNKENAQPYFLILDEMNLAHIEYYFADFLSVLESGRDKEGWTNEAIKLHEDNKIEQDDKIPREIKLPPNLYIIGTLNTDETTKSLSPKVLDRGFVLEFGDVDMEKYPPEPSGTAAEAERAKLLEEIIKPLNDKSLFLSHVGNKGLLNKNVEDFRGPKDNPTDLWERLATLNSLLKPHDLHFGYRVIDEIALFVIAAKSSKVANLDEREAFDLAVCSKVLPKFYGTRARLEKPLQNVIKWAGVPFKPEPGKELEEIEELISACEKKINGQQENQAQNPKNSEGASAPEGTEGAEGSPSADSGGEAQGIQTQFTYPHTALKALRMLRRLYEEGFASYL